MAMIKAAQALVSHSYYPGQHCLLKQQLGATGKDDLTSKPKSSAQTKHQAKHKINVYKCTKTTQSVEASIISIH
eukprot:15365956-Ditylum_brightwellii.AAC.1